MHANIQAMTGEAYKMLYTFSTFRAHSVAQISNGQYVEGLNSVDWDEERRQSLENALHNSTQGIYCTDFIVRL